MRDDCVALPGVQRRGVVGVRNGGQAVSVYVRRWVALVATLAVLLHGGALVRHNGAMLGALLEHAALTADLTALCHGSGAAADPSKLGALPSIPKPTDAQHGCPICSGQCPFFAFDAPEPAAPVAIAVACQWQAPPPAFRVPAAHSVCPPARAPPSRV